MRDYLISHALQNAWCSPSQDLQVILKPKRISKPEGVHTTVTNMWGTLPLPTNDRYHVYQIGQIHPSLLGLVSRRKVWMTLSEMMGVENLIADLYTDSGVMLPRFESWVIFTEDRTLILAVKAQPRIANLKTEPVYLRLYSNTFFSSDRADSVTHYIECQGIRVQSEDQALQFQRRMQNTRQRSIGVTNVYVDGVFVHDFLPSMVQPGTLIEYVYDSTVKAVLDFPISALETFDSLRDLKRKYLLTYAGEQVGGEIIDYRDDCDLHLIKTAVVNNKLTWDGVLFHKNLNDTFRNVTHRDYAVAVSTVNAYIGARPGWTDTNELTLRLHIRQGGYARPLIDEHHRIKELYRLPFSIRKMAMVGTEASVAVWHAASLENSDYVKLMDAYSQEVTYPMVQSGYGYNAMTRVLAESPIPVEFVHGRRQITVPPALQNNSTMYEYDANGKLLGYFQHTAGVEYAPQLPQTTLIEGIVGLGKFKIGTEFNFAQTVMEPGVDYRFYAAPIREGVVQFDEWMDVTGDDDFYTVDNDGRASWVVSGVDYFWAVKTDKDFLAYDVTLSPTNGLLKFTMDGLANASNSPQGVCWIPPGKIELFLNGFALIENLDYFAQGLSFVITNKKYLVLGNTQKLTVRATGFCKTDLTREAPNEAGFVRYGQLSNNTRFNTRNDKVMRLVVEGRTFHRDSVLFTEDDGSLYMENVPNGAPYSLDDVIVPLRDLASGETTYTLRAQSLTVDLAVEDYLTLKLPEPPETNPDGIVDKYPIYSPFSSTVMHDMINGVISMDQFKGQYSEMDVRSHLEAYEYLLDFDPCMKTIDLDHVSIHPHNLIVETVLDIYQYNFLNRAIKTYLLDRVDITRFVKLKPGYI